MNPMEPPAFDQITAPLAWWAQQRPDHPVLHDAGTIWRYGQLDEAVSAAATLLRGHGVRLGDRVVVVGENSAGMVALLLGASRAGAVIVPLNPRLTDREIDEIAAHAAPRCMVFVTCNSARARGHAERLGTVALAIDGLGAIAVTSARADTPPEVVMPDGVAAIIYTSGTTGRPKGVMLTHRNLMFSARASGAIRGFVPEDKVFSVLPMTHSLGFTGVLLGTMTYGATVVLAPRFDPGATLRAILQGGISVMIGAPSMYTLLAEYADRQRIALRPHGLRLIAAAGAQLDAAAKRTIEACFGMVLNNGYGITECAPTISQTRIDRPRGDCAVGVLLPGVEARLAEANDGVGTLMIRGPNVMAGYFRDAAATSAVLDAEGWFDTGDLARFDGDHLLIVGRAKEQITRFGYKIYPAEVEAVLNAHPDIRQSAVIGRGNGADQDVIAFVEPAAGSHPEPTSLMEYAARRLADYKRPAEIRLMAALPMAATGKVLKSALIA